MKRAHGFGRPFDFVMVDFTIKSGMNGAQTIKELIKIGPDVRAFVSRLFQCSVMNNYE
jgi:hypothetical protein